MGGVLLISERFMNVESDAKTYFIGIAVLLLLLVCSVPRKSLYGLKESLFYSGASIGFATVCLLLSAYGLLQYYGCVPSRHYAFPITGTYENPAGFAAVQAALFPFALALCMDKEREWTSCGIQTAEGNTLHYDNIPKGAMMWVSNYTRGMDERPFLIDDDSNVVWW